jgi:hypothetical protein
VIQNYPYITLTGKWPATIRKCIVQSRVHGLFASFYCLLYGIYVCVTEDLDPIPFLGCNHHYYEQEYGENIFGYFYRQPVSMTDQEDIPSIIVENPSMFLNWCRSSLAERKTAHALLSRFFQLNENINTEIALYKKEYFKDNRILGVHYRGRDKVQEAAIVPFEEYEHQMDSLLNNNLCDKIFFCTDELQLRERVKERYGDSCILYTLEADYRLHMKGGFETMGLHFNNPTPYLQAKDTLIECYLLSSCHLLASSTRSSFSLFATFLRPDIPHIIINA